MSKKAFKKYIKDIKKKGFTVDSDKSDYSYSAKDKNGNKIDITYFQETEVIDISVYGNTNN